MEPLLTTFIAAALGEWGDKTQLLVVALAARYGRPLPVLLGVALGAATNSAIAALGGSLIHGTVTLRAISLLTALALVSAGVGGFFPAKLKPMAESWRTGPLVTSAVCFFLLEFGDKTQFLTATLAAQFNAAALAAAGATVGVLASSVPAAALGPQLAKSVSLKAIRLSASVLFLLAGLIVGLSAMRLL